MGRGVSKGERGEKRLRGRGEEEVREDVEVKGWE